MIDSAYDHYVSVAYFSEEETFEKTKIEWYAKREAEKMFFTVKKKYKGSDQKVFIQLRDRAHNLLDSERNFGWEKRLTKKKINANKEKVRTVKAKSNRSNTESIE